MIKIEYDSFPFEKIKVTILFNQMKLLHLWLSYEQDILQINLKLQRLV